MVVTSNRVVDHLSRNECRWWSRQTESSTICHVMSAGGGHIKPSRRPSVWRRGQIKCRRVSHQRTSTGLTDSCVVSRNSLYKQNGVRTFYCTRMRRTERKWSYVRLSVSSKHNIVRQMQLWYEYSTRDLFGIWKTPEFTITLNGRWCPDTAL